LDALGAGRRFNVTAIDPSPLAAKQLSSTYPINVLQQRLEDFQQLGDYDCINARQSAYYFEDPQASILKLAVQLTMEGVLAVTLWSQECVLYRLNRAIAHAADSGIEGLQADRLLASLPADQFLVERHREQCGGLDFGMLRRDGSAFAAMVALAARTIDIGGLSESRLADLFATLESELMSGERSNELLFIRKRSNLPTSKQGR
jgi:hypothetical protein